MKAKLLIITTFLIAIFLIGCSTVAIKEVKTEDYIGKTVTIAGKVDNSMKLGKISGFTLKDEKGESSAVKSDTLPKEGERISVKGVVMKDTLFGYYILAED
jgi:aspartyl/asparaginyl-tRNA synthetase